MTNYIKKLVKTKRRLKNIYGNEIDDGVLVIREGITDIDITLESLAALSKIKVVIFPESLKSISNFFFGNYSVERVIFQSPVALKGEVFGHCGVTEVRVQEGFTKVETLSYKGLYTAVDSKGNISENKGNINVALPFANCSPSLHLTFIDPSTDLMVHNFSAPFTPNNNALKPFREILKFDREVKENGISIRPIMIDIMAKDNPNHNLDSVVSPRGRQRVLGLIL